MAERPPWHRRLASRYAAALAAAALGSTLLVAVPMYVVAARLMESALAERLEGTAELVAIAIAPDLAVEPLPGNPRLSARLGLLREEADLDALYLVKPDEEVTLVVGPPAIVLTEADRVALRAALHADAAFTPIQRDSDGLPFLSAFAPTEDSGIFVGLRVSASYLERLSALRGLFAGVMVTWGVLSAVLGAFLGAGLTRPIGRLAAATERLGRGELPEPPQAGGAAELDALQAAFASMAASVRRRESELRALAAAVAHEVRNPSHALRLHLGLLRRDLAPHASDPVSERLGTLERELDGLDATVDGFLAFASANTARRQRVGLRALLVSAAGGAPVDAPDDEVDVDPLLMGGAVGNLVRNARETGGEPVGVRGQIVGNDVRIEVVDGGPGFPPELVATAFEPFVSGRANGSGLGLAIVAAVAAAHGGSATVVRSRPGETVVLLRVPARA